MLTIHRCLLVRPRAGPRAARHPAFGRRGGRPSDEAVEGEAAAHFRGFWCWGWGRWAQM